MGNTSNAESLAPQVSGRSYSLPAFVFSTGAARPSFHPVFIHAVASAVCALFLLAAFLVHGDAALSSIAHAAAVGALAGVVAFALSTALSGAVAVFIHRRPSA